GATRPSCLAAHPAARAARAGLPVESYSPQLGRNRSVLRVFYWLAKFVFIGPFLRGLWRPWAEGMEHVPMDRPAILASNHLSFSDSFFFPVMVPRKVTFLAKSEYFTTPGIKG